MHPSKNELAVARVCLRTAIWQLDESQKRGGWTDQASEVAREAHAGLTANLNAIEVLAARANIIEGDDSI